jgi:hypothetical protein
MKLSSWVILLAAAMISASIAFSNHYGILALTEDSQHPFPRARTEADDPQHPYPRLWLVDHWTGVLRVCEFYSLSRTIDCSDPSPPYLN